MESKVLLFNERDEKVGDTYMRRARQLVGQQRASWVDESHSAIRFAPDDELNEIAAASAVSKPEADIHGEEKSKSRLYALAEKRLRERKMYILHILSLVPQFLIIAFAGIEMSEELCAFLAGCALTAFVIHSWIFLRERLKNFNLIGSEESRARQLAIEMDKLKRMGYAE